MPVLTGVLHVVSSPIGVVPDRSGFYDASHKQR